MQTINDAQKPWQSQPKLKLKVQNQPLRIIALGDSLVYGYGDPVFGGWVEQLRRQWMSPDSKGHVLYNLGIRGDTVTKVQGRLEHEFNFRGELRNRYPDLIILSVGVNDSPRLLHKDGKNVTNYNDFILQMDMLLAQAKLLANVLFIGMIPVDESKMPFLKCFYFNHRDQFSYKEVTKSLCQKHNIPYLDTFDMWISRGENWWRSRLSSDGLHPNEKGYGSLLEDVLNWQHMTHLV